MKKSTAIVTIIILLAVIAGAVWYTQTPTGQNKTSQPVATVSFMCDGSKTITAAFYAGTSTPAVVPGQPPVPTGSVAIQLSDGRAMTLPQTISADGARYANADESFVFWSKGNGALVLENNQEKSYTGCIALAPEPADGTLPQGYANSSVGFSLRLPNLAAATSTDAQSWKVDETYSYQELGPGKNISGVKFTIPSATAAGTNLGTDSYLSVEEIPNAQNCTANLFVDQQGNSSKAETINDNGTTYSFASSTGAGAGNRYEETIYALPGTNPCIAVRYFIHYGVIDNYPAGAVQQFDEQSLMNQFDAIRRTLVVAQ
jgi:membrane-bound inhibitor of C-type lysozyme